MVLTFEAVDETLKCDHSDESSTELHFPVESYHVDRYDWCSTIPWYYSLKKQTNKKQLKRHESHVSL